MCFFCKISGGYFVGLFLDLKLTPGEQEKAGIKIPALGSTQKLPG